MNSIHQRVGISARIDPVAHQYAKTKPNLSKYIESLIIQDMQYQKRSAIYDAITQRLLKDDEILALLAQRLNKAGPVVQQVDRDVTIVQGDWGA